MIAAVCNGISDGGSEVTVTVLQLDPDTRSDEDVAEDVEDLAQRQNGSPHEVDLGLVGMMFIEDQGAIMVRAAAGDSREVEVAVGRPGQTVSDPDAAQLAVDLADYALSRIPD